MRCVRVVISLLCVRCATRRLFALLVVLIVVVVLVHEGRRRVPVDLQPEEEQTDDGHMQRLVVAALERVLVDHLLRVVTRVNASVNKLRQTRDTGGEQREEAEAEQSGGRSAPTNAPAAAMMRHTFVARLLVVPLSPCADLAHGGCAGRGGARSAKGRDHGAAGRGRGAEGAVGVQRRATVGDGWGLERG